MSRYLEVEKGYFETICYPYICHDVLNYLDAAFPENRLGFPAQYFYPDIFLQMQTRFIYILFFYVGDFILTMPPCKVQETDYGMQARQFEADSFETCINFTYGHWYRPGKCWSFSFFKDHFKGLGRRRG